MADTVKHLYLCDMSPTMLQQAEGTPGLNITKKELDEEYFDVIYNILLALFRKTYLNCSLKKTH